MKILLSASLIAICSLGLFSFTNQIGFTDPLSTDGMADTSKAKKPMTAAGNYTTTLGGCNNSNGGIMKKEAFLNLMNSPLCGKDAKTNANYAVASFDINYCWRELSEDSTGHTIVISDCLSEPVDGNMIPAKWKKSFTENIYKGDTITFENIRIRNGAFKYKSKNKLVVVITE
jgi:hypothetical protein